MRFQYFFFPLVGGGILGILHVVYVNVLEHWGGGNAMFCLQFIFQGCFQIRELDTGFLSRKSDRRTFLCSPGLPFFTILLLLKWMWMIWYPCDGANKSFVHFLNYTDVV